MCEQTFRQRNKGLTTHDQGDRNRPKDENRQMNRWTERQIDKKANRWTERRIRWTNDPDGKTDE